ncbi:MAG: DJ-1/PfpI family protein [Anaerolineales bacterium]|nr:DJ-1/PfpI family protein [Anaerolineales bacterium]
MPQNNPMPPMTKFNDYIFVLLGHNFDERSITAVVTQLRQAGLLVKVVGLTPGQISGAHGLTLVPDLTLGKALTLASQVIGVIIPSASADSPALRNDPRLAELLERAISTELNLLSVR